jgi:IS30 family transposase
MGEQHCRKLGLDERGVIGLMRNRGESMRGIASVLGRSVSTVSDELRRNGGAGGHYVASQAQEKYLARRKRLGGRWRQPLKDKVIFAYVLARLGDGWTPEQIAGRLKLERGQSVICHETIYRYIYAKEQAERKLWELLPRGRRQRVKFTGRKAHKSGIPQRVSMRERPLAANSRSEAGHWEGDTVLGQGRSGAIHTEVERVSRYLCGRMVRGTTSEEAIRAQLAIFSHLPARLRQSTTLDNGTENHLHLRLHELGMRTYFADPYSAWQRGTNEYHNGLLRRYLPKGTSFADLTQADLDDIISEINNRPRKGLGYRTPQEVLDAHMGVRIQCRM